MKILVIGSGGREHALVWKIRQSERATEIFCAPGNGGIAAMAKCVDIKADDTEGLLDFALKNKIDLTVVGPEVPLTLGIVDAFERHDLKVFGPQKSAAALEGSKVFSKEFMRRYNIPTADFRVFDSAKDAENFVRTEKFPLVIKADGLAAGKGVVVCQNLAEAQGAIDDIMKKKILKEAGNRVVVEECLQGEEVSVLAISDGSSFTLLDSSQDHKRIFDNDVGPNTGGMGAYSPAPVAGQDLMKEIALRVIGPVIQGMRKDGKIFKGILYAGIMVTDKGPYVLEFNVRFGDPEAQALLPRLKNDLVEMMLASCNGTLHHIRLDWDRRACVCVVMSSRGYPGDYEKGKEITGLNDIGESSHSVVFHAGTVLKERKILTAGGRVLGVTSLGDTVEQAIERAYNNVEKIKFDGCFFRRDIGYKALKRSHV